MHCRRLTAVVFSALCAAMACGLAHGAPAVSSVTAVSSSVGRYDVFTIDFKVSTVAGNLYWPYDGAPPASVPSGVGVTVDGLFSKDNWATSVTVPGFYYQDYTLQLVGSNEYATPVGQPHWRVRFAPTAIGTWRYRIRVQDSSGTTTYPSPGDNSFDCTASQSHGFLRTSPTDSRYFETSDGTPLFGSGVNDPNFQTTTQADALFETYGSNGVKTVRWWMDYRGWHNPFGGGDVATSGGPQWSFSLTMSNNGGRKPGDRYSATVRPGGNTYQRVYLSSGLLYRLTGYVKTETVSGAAGKGVWAYVGTAKSAPLTGANDWTPFSMDLIPATTAAVTVGCRNDGTSGNGYFDDFSLRRSSDGGQTWSGECLSKGDIDFENYVDLGEAWKVDRIFQSAKQHGVYLKTVISEKQDSSLGCIGADGTTVARSDDNFYASDTHPSRWLQKAWWRYMTARWGSYTSLHSWELCNEGDPFSSGHWNAANALASYVHTVDPNEALCTTSFWHSIPMEFWKSSQCDYLDVHEYVGPTTTQTGSHGPRFYAWYDPTQMSSNAGALLPVGGSAGLVSLDSVQRHSGTASAKTIAKAGGNDGGWGQTRSPRYHVGIDPTHSYTFRFWAKADDVGVLGPSLGWTRPGLHIIWSKVYAENDSIHQQNIDAPLGTYDWRQVMVSGVSPPADANTVNIAIASTCWPDRDSEFRVDDLELIDETTGKNLFVDGGFEGDRIDYDSALAVKKYGVLLNSYGNRIGKPAIWGETGIRGANVYGSLYKGYSYTEENQQLVDDTPGIYIKKSIWAHVGPDNPNMLFWWTDNIAKKGLWNYFKAFQAFMAGIPVSNGKYKGALATTSASALRAWGQKDLTNNRAHLWIDNSTYTWKAVVDHSYSPEPWSSTATYAEDSTCGGGSPTHIYKSLQASNINHPVTDAAWWQDTGAFNASNNPPLPPPVTGAVTVSGLKNGKYKVEWCDTGTGVVANTEEITCTGGNLVLTVQNLQSDIACKIAPVEAKIDLNVTVPSVQVVPGQTVTVTVGYTNSGETEARSVAVGCRVPAQMTYVAGSAEATGGSYDAATGAVTWTVDSVAAHQTGSRTFQATVQ